MNITKTELKDILSGIDIFVPNVGLTTLKKVKMNKYLDFKQSGKQNPNPFYDQVLIEQRLSNLQTGFDYVGQLERKYKSEGITPTDNEDKKESWFTQVSKCLVVSKKNPNNLHWPQLCKMHVLIENNDDINVDESVKAIMFLIALGMLSITLHLL